MTNQITQIVKDKFKKFMTGNKEVQLSGEEYLQIGTVAESIWKKGISEDPPKFVIYTGGVASGKTTIRRQECADGYVHFDFGEISNAIKKEFGEDNPRLKDYIMVASDLILRESIEGKKNIVIEIIGDDAEVIVKVTDNMKNLGYEFSLKHITCDPMVAYERHLKAVEEDKDYTSAYFTQDATLSFFDRL